MLCIAIIIKSVYVDFFHHRATIWLNDALSLYMCVYVVLLRYCSLCNTLVYVCVTCLLSTCSVALHLAHSLCNRAQL